MEEEILAQKVEKLPYVDFFISFFGEFKKLP